MPLDFVKPIIYEFSERLDSVLYTFPFSFIQFVSALFAIALFAVWIYMLLETGVVKARINEFREMAAVSQIPQRKLSNQWGGVIERINTNDESQWKLAIIEADSILDELIKVLGYKGETMGERMANINPGQFPNLDDAWRAHKVRNFIAHDPSYKMNKAIVLRAIKIYELIFNEFNILK